MCRINNSSMWTIRILHELEYCFDATFLTLTYDDNHVKNYFDANKVSLSGTLEKRELVLYIKRIRAEFAKLYGQYLFKYFAVGEYGSETERPHYHIILMGLPYNDAYVDTILRKCWNYCDKDIGIKIMPCPEEAIRYVTGYVMKKLTGKKGFEEYEKNLREPPFMICSLGIGQQWMYDNEDYIRQQKKINLYGKTVPLPRYYRKKLELEITSDEELNAPITVKKFTDDYRHGKQREININTKIERGSSRNKI